MLVKELIKQLENLDPEGEISIAGLDGTGYHIGNIEEIYCDGNYYCIIPKEDSYCQKLKHDL